MQHRRPILIALLLALVTTAVFWEVPQQEFVAWDDNILVYNNPYLNPVTNSSVAYFWRHPYEQLYMPLTYSVWAILAGAARLPTPRRVTAGGYSDLDPRFFHTTNLILHLLNVLLVFVILRRLVGNDWSAAAGALLFGIHPVQVESVAWIAELKGVLSGFFSLLALWQYLSFACLGRKEVLREGATMLRQRVHYAVALLCYVLALLCKPSAVALPLIAWALDFWMLQRSVRRSMWALLPWMVIALVWSVLVRRAQPFGDFMVEPLWWRPLVASDALAFYVAKLIWPLQLGIDYGRTPAWVMSQKWAYAIWLVPAAPVVLGWWRRKQMPWLPAAGAVLTAAVLPVLGLIPFNFQQYSTVADRYLYLGLLGPALALAWVLAHVRRGQKTAAGLCILVLFGLGFRSAFQTLSWYNSIALYEHALVVNPRSWVAHRNQALALEEQGNIDEATAHLKEALRIHPDYALAHTSLALILAQQGQTEAASAHLYEVLRLQPNEAVRAEAHNNLGMILLLQGKTQEAIEHLRKTLRLQPNNMIAHLHLGQGLCAIGQSDLGITHLREAARLAPDNMAAQDALAQAQQTLNKKRQFKRR